MWLTCYQQGCIYCVRRCRIGRRNGCWDVKPKLKAQQRQKMKAEAQRMKSPAALESYFRGEQPKSWKQSSGSPPTVRLQATWCGLQGQS